jgi:hypothetical protein
MIHLIVELVTNVFFVALDTAIALIGRRRPVYADSHVATELGFALGVETNRVTRYLAIPGSDDRTAHYRLSAAEYRSFVDDMDAAAAFADECRDGHHVERLLERAPRTKKSRSREA